MRLSYRYILYIGILHIVFAGITYYLLSEDILYFLLAELLIIGSLYAAYRLYKNMIKPIQLMQSGSSAILDNDFSIKYIETGSLELDGLVKVYNKMIDRLREERTRVQEQSYFLEKLIEVSPIGMIIMDYDEKITQINPSALTYLELNNSALGKHLSAFNTPFINEILNLNVNESKVIKGKSLKKYKCRLNHVVHLGFPRRFILIEDLSTELMKTEKEAYGKVIRMMAHEVNNSMGAINSILNTVVEFAFDEETDKDIVDSLNIAIERNQHLSHFVDNFADILRLPEPNTKSVDINEILTKSVKIWQARAFAKNIEIATQLEPVVTCHIDPILIEQVITNIIKNSIESIKNPDGLITVRSIKNPPTILFEDNGTGVHPKVKDKLFTPFFSTKTNGQGIGLMLIREILMKHKADFSLTTNETTRITTFKIQFKK